MTDTNTALEANCICCCRPLSEHRQKDRMCQTASYFIENAALSTPPAPDQEPVAYMHTVVDANVLPSRKEFYTDNEDSLDAVTSLTTEVEPLYTHPQPDRVAELEKIIEEVNSWALCACITSPEDMYENFPRIVEITTLKGGA